MVIKWNDTVERMMLVKFLEQHLDARFDADRALETWPIDLPKPTKRSIGERLSTLKKQIRESKLTTTLSIGGNALQTNASTANTVPRTPRSLPNKRIKTTHDDDSGAKTCPPHSKASQAAIKTEHATSSSTFKAKLKAAAMDRDISKKRKRNSKTNGGRKMDSDEESMTSEASGSESDSNAFVKNESEGVIATGSRRSLPRRSKSMTPAATYQLDIGSEQSETEGRSEDEEQDFTPKVQSKNIKPRAKVDSDSDGEAEEEADNEEDAEDSEDSFSLSAHTAGKKNGHGQKAGKSEWRGRIARMDKHDVNEEDDD